MLVMIAPYFGVSDQAIINLSSINQDELLIIQRKKIENYFSYARTIPPKPWILLSGRLEEDFLARKDGHVLKNSNFSALELDVATHLNSWMSALIGLNSALDNGHFSKVQLDKGFITVGNFRHDPFYITLGQRYLPFGRYENYMVSPTFPQALGNTRVLSLLIGYHPQGSQKFYGDFYLFQGKTDVHEHKYPHQFGVTAGYHYKKNKTEIETGIDYIANLADSIGMQHTGDSSFPGFSENEQLLHEVPGMAIHGKWSYKQWVLLGEFITVIRPFTKQNLGFNGHKAKITGLNLQAAYNFHVYSKVASVALGYGATQQALALQLPRRRYNIVFNIIILKNTLISLELQKKIFYSLSDSASGQGQSVLPPKFHSADEVIFRFGVYF